MAIPTPLSPLHFSPLSSHFAFNSNFCLNFDLASKPHVIIVGGGIGGLMLAALLQHAQIPFTVLEQSSQPRLIGSAIALGPGVLPLFDQLGMLEEIKQCSRPVSRGMVWSEKLVPIMDLDHTTTQQRYGYLTRIIARSKLYQILLSNVSSEKVLQGKAVVSYTEEPSPYSRPQSPQSQQHHLRTPNLEKVTVTCSDGSTYTGDILVGADGAYSVTRRLMYQHIENDYAAFVEAAKVASIPILPVDKGLNKSSDSGLGSDSDSDMEAPTTTPYTHQFKPLPSSDKESLIFTSTCLVGQTRPGLDLGKFKYIRGPDCKVGSIVGDNKPYSWSIFSMPDDSICWMVTQHLEESYEADLSTSAPPTPRKGSTSNSRNSSKASSRSSSPERPMSRLDESALEWGPHKVEIMCEQVKDFPIPCGPGLKLSDLIQETDQEKISKVMLEEKLFETWSYGRTVLLGDACHKMHPSAGLGAVAAIQDAAVLSDIIYHLPKSPSLWELEKAFNGYRDDRFQLTKRSYETSYQMSHLNEQSWIGSFIRKVMSNLPKWIWYRVLDSMYEYRPQVSFLPKIPDHGNTPALPDSYLSFDDTVDMTDVD
ncbi:hypothetical protein BGZ76_009344 [Entomortierella beljakovae]|nr:hypothetical protein BGZ76_009344 [Entomortierella beljakovae]